MVRVIAVALALALPFGEAQAAELYTCKLRAARANDWVGNDLVVLHDREKGVVKVADAIIEYFHKGPIDGRVSEENAKRITFSWKVRTTNQSGQVAQMIYRASYLKGSGQASVLAQPSGYGNTFEKYGSCKLTRQ